MKRRTWLAITTVTVLMALGVRWYVPSHPDDTAISGATAAQAQQPASTVLQSRMSAVEAYLAKQRGVVGTVILDRETGAMVANRAADTTMPTMSTVKLGIALNVLERQAAGEFTLSTDDTANMHAMLNSSDNEATDELWWKYDPAVIANSLVGYGAEGITTSTNWIEMTGTAQDLAELMRYVLDDTAPGIRDYLVNELRTVAENQQWGVWGVGANLQPGNKNGWSDAGVYNSVGFAGEGERYVIAMMSTGINDTSVLDTVASQLVAAS